jgi:hypothetical protein
VQYQKEKEFAEVAEPLINCTDPVESEGINNQLGELIFGK